MKTSAITNVLYNLTRSAYEEAGFTYQRHEGKGNCVMTATIAPA